MDAMSSFSGGRELSAADAVILLKDPAKLEAITTQFKEQQAALEAAIALAGPADQILKLRDVAENDRKLARKALADAEVTKADARTTAASIVADASAHAQKIVGDARANAVSITAQADAALAAAVQRGGDLDKREGAIKQQESTLAAAIAQAEQTIADAAASKSAFEARQTALSAALRGV